jgi:GNAT superfamily N-acetyltransferase
VNNLDPVAVFDAVDSTPLILAGRRYARDPISAAAGSTGQTGTMDDLATIELGPSTVVLRRAEAGDVPAIVGLLAADQLGATRDGVNTAEDLAVYQEAFRAIDTDPAHVLVVAQDGRQLVGTLQLSFIPGLARRGALRAQIEAVRVDESYRGRGLGAAMFGWAIEEARRRGCALVQLTTDKARPDAHRFYERLGFVASHQGMKLTLG